MLSNNVAEARKYLVFRLGSEEYGIDIRKITTIIEKDMNITRVPKLPPFVKGIINLRGEIVPVISLRQKFDLPEDVFDTETRIVIVKIDEISVGLIVDSVAEVIELDEESIESIANIAGDLTVDYITGVGKADGRIITLLNAEKLASLNDDS